jgi:flavodoxin
VAYFSRSGNTREIARQVHEAVGGDLFEIQTATPYRDDYDAVVRQATEERESGYEPPLRSKVEDIGSYDVIFVGFPIWGMALPPPVRSFLAAHDLSGKTVVPFCTHKGYGRGRSFDTVRELCPRSSALAGFDVEGKRAAAARPQVTAWLRALELIRASRVGQSH